MFSRTSRALLSGAAVVALAAGGVVAASVANGASASTSMPTVDGYHCTITGTPGSNVLRGTPHHDVICGMGGNDTLIGGGGNDKLAGGGGNDTASFKDHTTTLVASLVTHLETDTAMHQTDHLSGISNLTGGQGNDVLVGSSGNNKLIAGPGNQVLNGGSGNDTLLGGGGHDLLIGGPGHDNISAGTGDDTIDGSDGNDTIDCGTGTSTVSTTGTDSEAPDCNGDAHRSLQRYHGTVAALDATANTVTVQWVEVNDNAQTWLDANGNPEPVVISLVGANIETSGGGHEGDHAIAHDHPSGGSGAQSGGTLLVGDRVEVEATTDTAGTGLVAVSVHTEGAGNEQHMQDYHGTVTSTDTTAGTIAVQWSETNDAATTWLAAHGNPNPITMSVVGANVETGGGHHGGESSTGSGAAGAPSIQVGDQVEVEATTSADGAGLVAVNVHAHN